MEKKASKEKDKYAKLLVSLLLLFLLLLFLLRKNNKEQITNKNQEKIRAVVVVCCFYAVKTKAQPFRSLLFGLGFFKRHKKLRIRAC